MDTTASDVLEDFDEALNAQGISLGFADRAGEDRALHPHDPRHFFPTIEAAVAAFQEETGAGGMGGQPAESPRRVATAPSRAGSLDR